MEVYDNGVQRFRVKGRKRRLSKTLTLRFRFRQTYFSVFDRISVDGIRKQTLKNAFSSLDGRQRCENANVDVKLFYAFSGN